MTPDADVLGRCPRCDAPILRGQLLITYDTDNGPAAYAECLDCEDVIQPE